MSPKITIVAAVAREGAIGARGDLAFHIRGDLRHFKAITLGKPVVMGRKTFESLPGGPLPGRTNIVITRNSAYTAPGVLTATSLDEAIRLAGEVTEIAIIGGGQIYAQALPLATTLQLTEIDAPCPDADTFFPALDSDSWRTEDVSDWQIDPVTQIRYRFVCLCRK